MDLPLVQKILCKVFIQLVFWTLGHSDEEERKQYLREYAALYMTIYPENPPHVDGALAWTLRNEEGPFRSDDVKILFGLRVSS